jgi:hypothetical protein
MMTKEEKLLWQRERRAADGNASTKKYEKTVNGFLMRAYRNMESRAKGIQKKKAHLYQNVTVLPRDEFYAWSKESSEFKRLWREWEESGHDRKLTPSVDRIDSLGSYDLDNMRWITHSENSRLGAISPRNRVVRPSA